MGTMITGSARGNGQQFGASAFVGDEVIFLQGLNSLANCTAHYGAQLAALYMIVLSVPRSQWAVSAARGGNAIGDPRVAYIRGD